MSDGREKKREREWTKESAMNGIRCQVLAAATDSKTSLIAVRWLQLDHTRNWNCSSLRRQRSAPTPPFRFHSKKRQINHQESAHISGSRHRILSGRGGCVDRRSDPTRLLPLRQMRLLLQNRHAPQLAFVLASEDRRRNLRCWKGRGGGKLRRGGRKQRALDCVIMNKFI